MGQIRVQSPSRWEDREVAVGAPQDRDSRVRAESSPNRRAQAGHAVSASGCVHDAGAACEGEGMEGEREKDVRGMCADPFGNAQRHQRSSETAISRRGVVRGEHFYDLELAGLRGSCSVGLPSYGWNSRNTTRPVGDGAVARIHTSDSFI